MNFGIGFMVDENGKIRNLVIITSKDEIKEVVDEQVETTKMTIKVRRLVTLPTESKVSDEEARRIANEWWKKYSEMKILDVLRRE